MPNSTLLQIREPLLRFGPNLTSFCRAINQEDGSDPSKNWLAPHESETYWRNNPLKQSKPVQFCLSTVYCYRAVIQGVPLSAPPPHARHTQAPLTMRGQTSKTAPLRLCILCMHCWEHLRHCDGEDRGDYCAIENKHVQRFTSSNW